MKKLNFTKVFGGSLTLGLGCALFSCATSQPKITQIKTSSDKTARTIASLDNNGDVRDDSFDPNLETFYGGSQATETKANEDVAAVIRAFIESQQKTRQEKAASSEAQDPDARRVFNDLPKPDYATRDVHRKANGCMKAEMNFAGDLLPRLNAQILAYRNDHALPAANLTPITNEDDLGIFGHGRSYDAVVRFSNGHPGNRPDRLPDARGLAVKLLPKGTLGDAPINASSASVLNLATSLDILSINFPTFFVNDPIKYAAFNKLALESSTDFKNKLLAKGEEFTSVFETGKFTSLERRLALWVNGSVIYSPLYQDYFSMVPSRLGPEGAIRAVKYSWKPVACPNADAKVFEAEKKIQYADWTTDHTYSLPPSEPDAVKNFPDDYLRQHLASRITQGDACFDLYLQLYRDSTSTNLEDSTDIWPRTQSEKDWWAQSVVPSFLIWNLSLDNNETRKNYLDRFQTKRIAPAIWAGKLTIKKVVSDEPSKLADNNQTCEDLSFNPWNGDIAHHKPLGIVSRMKRKVYNASRRERHELNGISDKAIERPTSE